MKTFTERGILLEQGKPLWEIIQDTKQKAFTKHTLVIKHKHFIRHGP